MPIDYDSIRDENLRKYGTDIARYGRDLFAERYGDKTHFILEVLQNAEDALQKRIGWSGSRSVNFSLGSKGLIISHFGKPFDEDDVRGVCGIGESSKKLTDIGQFGIGFKSVYAFTGKPEIHSGSEHFAIDSYVRPRAVDARELQPDETVISMPFSQDKPSAKEDILRGLRTLGLRTLLFLREIEEISWSTANGASGLYIRDKPENIKNVARKVQLVGQDATMRDREENYIVFSRDVFFEGKTAGYVELAFALHRNGSGIQDASVRPVTDSPLVVFFPTVLTTHLGFLVQGPYRTTPSRDNVPRDNGWNRYLVTETASLLVHALRGLRELGLLGISALECLPLNPDTFSEDSRFAPLFQAVKKTLQTEPMLPGHHGSHIAGRNAKLGRTRDLRDLLDPNQLARLFPSDGKAAWLSGGITVNRTPELHKYLTEELGIEEVTPESLIPKLKKPFLESQTDEWIQRLYEFLGSQQALLRRLRTIPVVRIIDGSHVVAFLGEKPQAYLPGEAPSGFPTVKPIVCQRKEAKQFLKGLGLRLPDPVDDVIANVLPKYSEGRVDVSANEYQYDVEKILSASKTDSNKQLEYLLSELKKAKFVSAVDAGSGDRQFVRPAEAYLTTQRLKSLFEGVPSVWMVDDSREFLQGDDIQNLLKKTGAAEHLARVEVESSLTWQEKNKLRGDEDYTRERGVEDYTLRGLDPLLAVLTNLPNNEALNRAGLLWEAMDDMAPDDDRDWLTRWNRELIFRGSYRWFYYTKKEAKFDAHFVKTLRETAWVPDNSGALQVPSAVVFKITGWKKNDILAKVIPFKPAPRATPDSLTKLSDESGIEPGALKLLKEKGLTSEADVRDLIALRELATESDAPAEETVATDALDNKSGTPTSNGTGEISPVPYLAPTDVSGSNKQSLKKADGPKSSGKSAQRKFVSYVAVSPDEEAGTPDTLEHQRRMKLEKQAIDLILSKEPNLRKTPTHNPGYDLTEEDIEGNTVRWIEVKSMAGTLMESPVTMTRKQFEIANERRDSYWLYMVEKAGNPGQSTIIRIKNPAGRAQRFTYDHGWTKVSEDSN